MRQDRISKGNMQHAKINNTSGLQYWSNCQHFHSLIDGKQHQLHLDQMNHHYRYHSILHHSIPPQYHLCACLTLHHYGREQLCHHWHFDLFKLNKEMITMLHVNRDDTLHYTSNPHHQLSCVCPANYLSANVHARSCFKVLWYEDRRYIVVSCSQTPVHPISIRVESGYTRLDILVVA